MSNKIPKIYGIALSTLWSAHLEIRRSLDDYQFKSGMLGDKVRLSTSLEEEVILVRDLTAHQKLSRGGA